MAGHNVNDERPRTVDVEFDRNLQFSKMFLSNPVTQGLERNNFIHPSPIQARAIPLGKLGFDLLVQAKSGTGKTLVFAVLIAEAYNPDVSFPQSLTIVPTREIAVQIEQVINRIGYSIPNFQARSFIGGTDISLDRKNLNKCSAIIGTPGRIGHLIKNNVLNTSQIKVLVLDEADSLISGTLKSEVDEIIRVLPTDRQTIVCSATFYNNKDRKLLKYLNDKFIGVTPRKEVPVLHGIRQFVCELPETKDNIKEMMAKIAELSSIFKKVPYSQCLVFANTQTKADTYCSYLKRAGWPAEVIRGGQEQHVRLKTVDNLKQFRCRILMATDVIARGIDAENVNLVINVDVPRDNSVYLHRIGRAGRFGTQAISITMVSTATEMERFRKILFDIGGGEMFVYKLPTEAVEEIWNFEEYGDKYGKLYASKLEQEICDHGSDKLLLATIQEVDSQTELGCKSAENLEDSLEKVTAASDALVEDDSIEQIASSSSTGNKLTGANEADEEQEQIVRIIPFSNNEFKSNSERIQTTQAGSSTVLRLFPAAAQNKAAVSSENHSSTANELQKVNAESNRSSVENQMFHSAMSKLEMEMDLDQEQPQNQSPRLKESREANELFLNAMKKLDSESLTNNDAPETESHNMQFSTAAKAEDVDQMFMDAMNKLDLEDNLSCENGTDSVKIEVGSVLGENPCNSPDTSSKSLNSETASVEFDSSSPASCCTSDSTFSSNTTKKVEVGSNFTTPNSRVQEIRGAAPIRQISSSSSDGSSELSHSSDPEVPNDQNCMPLEVNNDALFAKIMEQKEIEAGQYERPLQVSIDGCSLEVHDDPVSERDLNSRKGSVPDVVPNRITLDPSRLQNRPSIEEEIVAFELNSNTCSSNHGSVFEPEEAAVVAQEHRPKRIRFQQDDQSLELKSNSVGVMVSTSQQSEQVEQDQPITDEAAATEEAEDASSYSSEYDSQSSSSSFFDRREWESETISGQADKQPPASRKEPAKICQNRCKANKRMKNASNHYHRTYSNWTNQYWNQITMIQDYVRFTAYARHSDHSN